MAPRPSRLWHARPHDGPRHSFGAASVVRLDLPDAPGLVHRDVAANGARFHIAELGDGPLVLLLHGFPQFWWTWRHQLTALADAGFRAVAMDLRGVGGSDRTPRGYDPANLALDITGVIRSLGEPDAALVGHDLGGYLAWTAAAMRPKLVRRLAVSSMPHPRRWRSSMLADARQTAAQSHIWGFQRPWIPERLSPRTTGRWWLGSSRSGRGRSRPTRRPWRPTGGPCASRPPRTARSSRTGGWCGRWPARTAFSSTAG
ncbi:alpha/beta fold hydrolase [Streptomyces thermocarboxydus]